MSEDPIAEWKARRDRNSIIRSSQLEYAPEYAAGVYRPSARQIEEALESSRHHESKEDVARQRKIEWLKKNGYMK